MPDNKYLDDLEKRVNAHVLNHEIWEKIKRDHAALRRTLLAEGPPRSTCPGCFSAIYDGAAEQGWCCDCMPKRSKYEKEAYGY
jgi:hypothetical protein